MADAGWDEEHGVMSIAKQINYVKPNMTNLRGKVGRSIIKTIRSTPKPDLSEVKRKSAEAERRMLVGMESEENDRKRALRRLRGCAVDDGLTYEQLREKRLREKQD